MSSINLINSYIFHGWFYFVWTFDCALPCFICLCSHHLVLFLFSPSFKNNSISTLTIPLNRSRWTYTLVTTLLQMKPSVWRSSAASAAVSVSKLMFVSCSMRLVVFFVLSEERYLILFSCVSTIFSVSGFLWCTSPQLSTCKFHYADPLLTGMLSFKCCIVKNCQII